MVSSWERGKKKTLYCHHCRKGNESIRALWPSLLLFTAWEISLNWRAELVFTTKGTLLLAACIVPEKQALCLVTVLTKTSVFYQLFKHWLSRIFRLVWWSVFLFSSTVYLMLVWLLLFCFCPFLSVLVHFSVLKREVPLFLTYIYPNPRTNTLFFFFFFFAF